MQPGPRALGYQGPIKSLWLEIDTDGGGFITFDEMESVTRRKLKVTKSQLSEDGLKGLWCAIETTRRMWTRWWRCRLPRT